MFSFMENIAMSAFPAAQIPDTEVRIVKSTQLGRDFRISIALPYEYPDFPDKTYLTVYILDANLYFGMFTEISRMLYIGGLTETIIVGIGYLLDLPLKKAFTEFWALRSLDLTPVADKAFEDEGRQMGTGGAANFLSFIAENVIPMVETEYRATPADRTLVGHSLGGLFAIYTLFQKPSLFQQLMVGSPALWFGDGTMFDQEEDFSKDRKSLPVKLYLSAGALEESVPKPRVSDLYKLKSLFESRAYEDFELTFQIFDNCNHCAASAPMFQFGMMALMPPRTG
jgi:predicted alpha/beta superfamily hydrolase